MSDCAHQSRLCYRTAGLRMSLALLQLRLALRAGFDPNQPRDERGRWADGGLHRVVVTRIDRTGNEKIDRKTDILLDVAKDVIEEVGAGSGPLYGVLIHSRFAAAVRELGLPGIGKNGVEESFSIGETARYGLTGSKRTDVILRDGRTSSAPILAVWDLKTGTARLEADRVDEIRKSLGVGVEVPIIEIHVGRGVSVKSVRVSVITNLLRNR